MRYRDEISLLAAGLGDGDTSYTSCPSCGREGKFSVSRSDSGLVLYRCFRSSCTLHGGGALSDGGSIAGASRQYKAPTHTPFNGMLAPLTVEQQTFLYESIGWADAHCKAAGVRWAPEMERYAFAIRGPRGDRRGWCLRSYSGASPKAKTYMDRDDHRTSFYRKEGSRKVLAVEDIPSAVRASTYVNAVALLGTSCNTNQAWEIAEQFDHITWALDADATRQAFKLRADHALLFKHSDVLILHRDLKDEGELTLEDMLDV